MWMQKKTAMYFWKNSVAKKICHFGSNVNFKLDVQKSEPNELQIVSTSKL